MATDPVPIRPGMHYQMGGIKTDIDGRTNVPGLYAAGETACVSVHGGNRLGANSLLDTLVFGRRSGEHAANLSKSISYKSIGDSAANPDKSILQDMLDREGGIESFGQIRLDMGIIMNDKLAVFRNHEGIEQAISQLLELRDRYSRVVVSDKSKTFNTNLIFTLELGFMLDCAETCLKVRMVQN